MRFAHTACILLPPGTTVPASGCKPQAEGATRARRAARPLPEIGCRVRIGRPASPGGYRRTSPSRYRGTCSASLPACPCPQRPAGRPIGHVRQGLAAWRARTATPAPRPKKRARRDARLAIRCAAQCQDGGRRISGPCGERTTSGLPSADRARHTTVTRMVTDHDHDGHVVGRSRGAGQSGHKGQAGTRALIGASGAGNN
jgi:hypothetical protein